MISSLTTPIHLPLATGLIASRGLDLGVEEKTKFTHSPSWANASKPLWPSDAPTAGYLCGGAGIMTAGFEMAGVRSLWNIDRDPSDPKLSDRIADIYERNFNSPVIRSTLEEVAETNFARLERPEILVLTQSCRNLSRSNPKNGETQADTSVAQAAVKAVEYFLPRVFVAENVPEYQRSQSWEILRVALIRLGYSINSGIFDAAKFGVPQNRRRFIAMATLNAPAPKLTATTVPRMGWYEAIADLLPTLEEITPTAKQLQKIESLPFALKSVPLLVERVASWGDPKVREAQLPSWTIRKSIWLDQRHCSRPQAINIRLPDGTWKNLGIVGAARLMSVPDWFCLEQEAWCAGSALGNGVPSLLAKVIASALLPFISSQKQGEEHFISQSILECEKKEEKTMPDVTFELLAQSPVEPSLLSFRSNKTSRDIKVNHLALLECPSLEARATEVIKSSFCAMKNSFMDMVEEGKKLLDLRDALKKEHGEKKGNKRFNAWLRSRDWGGYGTTWVRSALLLAAWWDKLPSPVQAWLPKSIQTWSRAALSRLAVATDIGINFCLGLVKRGKQTAQSITNALTSRRLQIGANVQLLASDSKYSGLTGKVIDIATVNEGGNITVEFNDGKKLDVAPEDIVQQKGFKEDPPPVLEIGTRIKVKKDDSGWLGATGVVVEKWTRDENCWWVLLDSVVEQGLQIRHLFKAHQLELEKKPRKPSSPKNAEGKVYTEAEVEKLRAQWEDELKERLESQIRQELLIGMSSQIREELERQTQEGRIIERQLREKAEREKQQLKIQLEEVQSELISVRALAVENQQLQQRIRDLEKILNAANQDTWAHTTTFTKQAAKVVNAEIAKTNEILLGRVEALQEESTRQQAELEQYRQEEVGSREKEPEQNLIKEFGQVAENLGLPGWSGNKGYRGSDGNLYTGFAAMKAFVKDSSNLISPAIQETQPEWTSS